MRPLFFLFISLGSQVAICGNANTKIIASICIKIKGITPAYILDVFTFSGATPLKKIMKIQMEALENLFVN